MTSPRVPLSIKVFYDRIIGNPTKEGPPLFLVKEVVSEDWNTRPNPLNPVEGTGPFPKGLRNIAIFFGMTVPGQFDRKFTLTNCQTPKGVNGQFVAVISAWNATIPSDLSDTTSLPMFPGIPVSALRGKNFRIQTIDLHLLDNGKFRRSWHGEDWASALEQMLKKSPAPNLDMPIVQDGPALTRVPKAVENFYDLIRSDLSKYWYDATQSLNCTVNENNFDWIRWCGSG